MAWLPEVMKGIAEKIISDDWVERQSPDAMESYYVIGAAAYRNDLETNDYTDCFVLPRPEVGPLAEHVVRSQVAGSRRDDLKRERKRLERAGISATDIDRFIGGDAFALSALFGDPILQSFLEALRISRGLVSLDDEEARDVDAAREKICLREVVWKYGKIVDRWEQLDPLPFSDQQFEEASKAYLYGFYRASVVLSASTLEKHLKRAVGVYQFDTYKGLVEDAAVHLGADGAWIAQAKTVFRIRNTVVHDDHAPEHDEAGEVLSNTRGVLTSLLSVE
jgi:hypothetical protein